jgi:hypothetical protein
MATTLRYNKISATEKKAMKANLYPRSFIINQSGKSLTD